VPAVILTAVPHQESRQMTRTDACDDNPEFAFDEPLLDLDGLLVEVVDCCRDLASVRLDRVGERELLVALSELMSIEVMLEGVQRRLAERIDAYLAEAHAPQSANAQLANAAATTSRADSSTCCRWSSPLNDSA
jgi:hypothetical protein